MRNCNFMQQLPGRLLWKHCTHWQNTHFSSPCLISVNRNWIILTFIFFLSILKKSHMGGQPWNCWLRMSLTTDFCVLRNWRNCSNEAKKTVEVFLAIYLIISNFFSSYIKIKFKNLEPWQSVKFPWSVWLSCPVCSHFRGLFAVMRSLALYCCIGADPPCDIFFWNWLHFNACSALFCTDKSECRLSLMESRLPSCIHRVTPTFLVVTVPSCPKTCDSV